jgi:hypothetical protein
MKKSTMLLRLALAVAAAALIAGCQRNISGSYLASDNSAVCWLQLVRTPDNHLTGQLASSVLKPDGHIEQNSASVTGAIDGENVTLSGSGFLGLQSFTLSGTLNGNTLTLTGAQSIPIVFKGSTLSEFQKQMGQLNARSSSITEANLEAQTKMRALRHQENFVTEVDLLVKKMEEFERQADVHLERFPNGERNYEEVTDKVRAYVARERQLSGNPNAGVARSQLSVAATQASLQTDQIHYAVEQVRYSLDSEVKPLLGEYQSLQQQCHSIPPNVFTLEESQNINAACVHLEGDGPRFQEKFKAMTDGLSHLEQVYQREQNTQQRLIQESNRLD